MKNRKPIRSHPLGRKPAESGDRSRQTQEAGETADLSLPPGAIECPDCAERIMSRAKVCRYCGFDIKARKRKVRNGRGDRSRGGGAIYLHAPSKSPGTAAVLAFFIPGLGHIYAGRIFFGICFMILAPLLLLAALLIPSSLAGVAAESESVAGVVAPMLVMLLLPFGIWVWQLVDAYNTIESENRRAAFRARRR